MRIGLTGMVLLVAAFMMALIGKEIAASRTKTPADVAPVGALTTASFGTQAAAQAEPQMSEDVFKNVQALKGISVDDFILTMGIMSAALGYDCAECHPSAGSDKVDWAFDTQKKRTARKMVEMVTAINRDNFRRRQLVTCWTCHRGRDHPVVTPTLAAVYGTPSMEPDDILTPVSGVPPVDQILDKYLAALGGAQKLAGLSSFSAKGKSVGFRGFGGGAVVEIFAQAPDKRATHITFPEAPDRGNSTRTYDGRTGWLATPMAVVRKYELAGSELRGARLDAQLSFPGQIKNVLTNLRVGPPTTIDDKAVHVVQGNATGGMFASLFFDQTSGLLVRMVRYGNSPIGRIPTQIDYADYRDVDGIKFPFRITFAWLDGRDNFELSEVKVNTAIDPAIFGEPR